MSDRRRSLFILLLVLGLIAASAAAVATKETTLGIMRERVDAFGVAEPELQLLGRDQIEVNLPGVEDAERAAAQVGSTAQLFFYDWEKNVLDETCRTNETEIN